MRLRLGEEIICGGEYALASEGIGDYGRACTVFRRIPPPTDQRWVWRFSRVQSGFAVLTIVAFGTLTLVLHAELLRGDRAALGFAGFVGVYWTTRVLVDTFYFSPTGWPKGKNLSSDTFSSLLCFSPSRQVI
jgi:hypothetical protein